MITAIVRMPVKRNGKKGFGKPEKVTFANRAELNEYTNGVMKGAKVKIITQSNQGCGVQNRMMQKLCGV